MIRILIADDQELVRTGFRVVLDAEPDFEVVGEAADGLADHFEIGFGVEDDAEAGADELLVVGDQDPDHGAAPSGRRARTA